MTGPDHEPAGTGAAPPAQSPGNPRPVSGGGAKPVAVIEAVGLTRRLAGEVPVTLVQDVRLRVDPGEFICIMGPSGSGKSSLLYLLGLLDRPDEGRVLLAGEDTTDYDEDRLADCRLQRLGYVFQFHFLLAEFTVLENVALPMRRLGRLREPEWRARALGLLQRLGIAEHADKRPHQLSGGQRQRVAIARALANDPVVILADEPTGNLDSVSSANVRSILREISRESGRSVVAVTHDPQFAALADRHVEIVDGRVRADP